MPKITIQEASDLLGVHPDTMRRWESSVKIVPERTAGGHRRYDVAKLLGRKKRAEPASYRVRLKTYH